MTIAAERITEAALLDMIEIFNSQPWTMSMHAELTALWAICDSREQQELLKFLICRFIVLDHALEISTCKEIDGAFQRWGLVPGNTRVVAVADGGEVDGSTAGLQKLKNKISPAISWHSRFYSNIPAVSPDMCNGEVIVLFDDFIGTGKKFCDKVDWVLKIAQDNGVDVSIKGVAFAGMEFGVDQVRAKCGIELFVPNLLKKGISELKPADEVASSVAIMEEIEAKLARRIKSRRLDNFLFGYGRSECLYFACNDNCPNNVFPVFWWRKLSGGGEFPTLLTRVG